MYFLVIFILCGVAAPAKLDDINNKIYKFENNVFNTIARSNQPNNVDKERIIGGDFVKDKTKFPHQVSIRINNQHVCGGTIINERYVITSCQCVVEKSISHLSIVGGGLTLSDRNVVKNVSEIKTHPNFNRGTLDSDVALIKIDGTFTINSTVAPLALGKTRPIEGKSCSILGWGGYGFVGSTKALKVLSENVVNTNNCNHTYEGYLRKGMFCAKSNSFYAGACNDDLGGPIICDNALAGIIIHPRCNDVDMSTVYTDVASYLDWIKTNSGSATTSSSLAIVLFIFIAIF